jgi:hypothetical protein
MKLTPRSVFLRLLVLLLGALAFCFTPAWASDPKKSAPPEEEAKKLKYANEAGENGRSGYVYKRVLKSNPGEPTLVPWEPAKDPKLTKKEEQGKSDSKGKPDAQGEKKADKKDDAGEAKKEEKKKEDKKGGDAKAKAPELPLSAVYDPNVIKLDTSNRPFTKAVQTNDHADYFLCRKTITDKYRDTVLAEINTFADRMGLPHAQLTPCMVKVAKANTKLPGAIFIEFYVDEEAVKACIKDNACGSTRVMMLYPKDKTGKKSQEIFRSYVLTDERKFLRSSFCVSPQGQLLGEKSCYVAVNPDWLFN